MKRYSYINKTQPMHKIFFSSLLAMITLASCAQTKNKKEQQNMSATIIPDGVKTDTADFGSGCFWCTEAIFQRLKGVYSVRSGYGGGHGGMGPWQIGPKYRQRIPTSALEATS